MSNVAYANFTARKSHNDRPNSVGKGFALLHRKIKDLPFYKKDSEAVHLWIHIILSANYSPELVNTDFGAMSVNRGEFITGRNTLSAETGISGDRVKYLLNKFEKLGMITRTTNNKFTRIFVTKYDDYQLNNVPADCQQSANANPHRERASEYVVPTECQQSATKNEYTNKSNTNVLDMSSGDDQSSCKKTKSKPIPYQAILNAYNETAGDRLPNAEKLNSKRRTAIKRMLLSDLNKPTLEAATAYFQRFMETAGSFYFGDNSRGWKASFDYLLQPDTITKTREGSL